MVEFNFALSPLQLVSVPDQLHVRVIDRKGPADHDPVDAVLDEIKDDPQIDRLVVGIKKRRPIGKALLGTISQPAAGGGDPHPRHQTALKRQLVG